MYNDIKRLFDLPFYQQKQNPIENAFTMKRDGTWISTSLTDFIADFTTLSKALLELGIKRGENIGIITDRNRTEWHILDYAIQQAGAISVPIYPTVSETDLLHIFSQAEIGICFASNEALAHKIVAIKPAALKLNAIFTFETVQGYQNLEDLYNIGRRSTKDAELESIKASIQSQDLVTIIYTSGTTGSPKGVMLSHQNLLSNVYNCTDCMPEGYQSALSFLPICHVFERTATYRYMIDGVPIYFAESIEKLAENAKEIQPHLMTVVPRLIEKIYDKIIIKAQELSLPKRIIFKWALKLAEKYEPYTNQGFYYQYKLKIARKLVFSKWKEALGGNIKGLICGSAPISQHLIRIFMAAEMPILEGYGLTETSPIVAGAKLEKGRYEVGTCGRPLLNMEIKFADDGEILVKGDNIMMGYYKEPALTQESFTSDGFFQTGDIGELTTQGLLKITDRKKEMFKTSGGKYIAPQLIESLMKTSQFIEQIMVVGAGEKMACAFIVPEFDYIQKWITHKGLPIDINSKEAIINSLEVYTRVQQAVNELNEELGQWEQIKKFSLISEDWTIENNMITPTLKLKRKNILAQYKMNYEKMYGRA